ncbi:uncharacterized protein B0H64DRAFT_228943 [Chaetomium fimeti]|uniref:Uncharacterized protein n=1 Tax=Chaetomium fimeti TaxID=1854472 RepID=A0AAE0LPC4_9PEZI|nr:hypothetical protein B0H64DRAFT_228943 [Chaetomium fimeti]
MGPLPGRLLLSHPTRPHQHTKTKTTKHKYDTHKPVCTIRCLSGSFGHRVFFIIQTESRLLVSSRGGRFFAFNTRYTFRREQSRITVAVFFVSVFQRYPTRTIVVSTTRQLFTRPASRSEDGRNGSHDHVTAAPEMVALLPITGVQELQKLPVFCFPLFLSF